MTFACVLRSGGVFTPEWVTRLRDQVARHSFGWRFVCLSDVDVPGVETLPLVHDWPGWWSKLELFRPGLLEGPVCYMDLDTLVVDDLSPFEAYTGDFAALSDFYTPTMVASGVLLWNRAPDFYAKAIADPPRMRGRSDPWYDGMADADRIQDLFPGMVGSYKAHEMARLGPQRFSVVCFHGKPKQPDLTGTWVEEAWR